MAYSLDKRFEADDKFLAPLFVADTYITQSERSGVSHVGTHLAPDGSGVAIGKFNQVEGVVNIGLKAVDCYVTCLVVVLILAGESYAHYRKRCRTHVFAELEKLEKSESAALVVVGIKPVGKGIVPAVFVERTVFDGTYGVFPLIAGVQVGSFHNASTGESEHTGMGVGKSLCEVGA